MTPAQEQEGAQDVEVSVVIPAYNEEARLGPTLEATAAALAARGWRHEILVVDDGSTDGTVALADRLAARWPAVRVLATAPNRGKGHAVRVGMLAARGARVVMCDADGSTPASELSRLLTALERGAAVAIGSRYADGARPDQPTWRRVWSRMVNLVVRRTIIPGVRDTHCGFKAFTSAAARDLFGRATVDGWGFDLEVLAMAHRLGHRVVEVPVTWHDDRRSRVRPLHDLARVWVEVRAIRRSLAVVERDVEASTELSRARSYY